MNRIARLDVLALFPFATAIGLANASTAATTAASSRLRPTDYNFVEQANLGAPFQVDSGRLAERKAGTAAVRDYAHLMVVTHIPVVDALNAILRRKGIDGPANTLLRGAYDAMISTLKNDRGTVFDRDYVDGQVDYQKGNRHSSRMRSRTAPIRISKNLPVKRYQRSRITWNGHCALAAGQMGMARLAEKIQSAR
jgi:putative membrane protein